jgi:hypothetical protein
VSTFSQLGQLIAIGFGQPQPASLRTARATLTAAERRRVQRLVRRGEPAWDQRSAAYAVALGRQRQQAGPRAPKVIRTSSIIGAIGAAIVLIAALATADWFMVGFAVLYDVLFAFQLSVGARWRANALRAPEINASLAASPVDPAVERPEAEVPLGPGRRIAGAAAAFVVFFVAGLAGVLVAQVIHDGDGLSTATDLAIAGGMATWLTFTTQMVAWYQRRGRTE